MICATDHSTRHGRFKPPSFESLWDSSDVKDPFSVISSGSSEMERGLLPIFVKNIRTRPS